MINIGAGMKASRSHELLSSSQHVPNNGLMDGDTKHKFKVRLGLPSKVKTYGVDVRSVLDLYQEADYKTRLELDRLGLYGIEITKEVANIEKMDGRAMVTLPPLYNETKVAFELRPGNKVETSFIIPVDYKQTFVQSFTDGGHNNFYSLTYQSRAIISAPNEFFSELKKRGKGLIIQTSQDGRSDIVSSSCLLYQVEYHKNKGEGVYISYREIPNNQESANKAYSSNNLAAIIRN